MRNNLASTRFLFALVGIRFLVLGTTVFSGLIIRHTLDFHNKYFRTLLEGLYVSSSIFPTYIHDLSCTNGLRQSWRSFYVLRIDSQSISRP